MSLEQELRRVTTGRDLYKLIGAELEQTGNVKSLLPLLFRFNGRPVTLDDHFPFEVCFYHRRPRRMQKKCGRQVGKSFQNAMELIVRGILVPNWNTLYVTPLFETVRRFSTQYVKALIEQSPAKRLMTMKGATSQVLQRTLGTQSTIFFGYAQRDADRIRGINGNEGGYDEVQLMNPEVFPVIQQTMGGSPFGEYETFAGTPLSLVNHTEKLFNPSTMSEWMMKCEACGKENIAASEYDLFEIIGPVTDDIGPGNPGTRCRNCKGPLYPERGRWWHRYPERRDDFLGIHVPQVIMPWHAYSRDRWIKLWDRLKHGSQTEVYNELMGEACDSSFKPVSIRELKRAAILHSNTLAEALAVKGRYTRLAIGIDWGGGGMSGLSRTKAAIVGMTPTGKTDVIFGVDLNFSHDPFEEVKLLMILAQKFGVEIIAHDAGGGVGATREALMFQTNLRMEVWPMNYTGPTGKGMLIPRPPSHPGEKMFFTLDKARSIDFVCQAIKQGFIRTFKWDFISDNNPGLLYDFTSLSTEIAERVMGSDVFLISKEEGSSDDFVHAVNFACCALWGKYNAWPQLSTVQHFKSMQQIANIADEVGNVWDVNDIDKLLARVQMGGRQ